MSHLTAPMPPQAGHHLPQKPYLFDFPRPAHPLTPPDTDYETLSHQAPPAQNAIGLEADPLPPQVHPSTLDSPYATPYGTLHRKRSSVTYVNSGIREARDRVVHRGLKWLVVVVPPVSMTREHGHLGHTLSSGPSRRLSNGILLPLYPTLNSQLGAIAREFSFPSISGLCVYLHTTHSGVALSPRVSEDTWPLLWSHLFDARSPSLPAAQLPISGQIEFDVDLTRARWYDSWVASSRRDYVDVPQSVAPSRPQSLSHWRADSQGSINDPVDDQTDVISLAPQTATRATGRNIKKLSLLDRFDTVSVRSGSKLVPRDESPPSQSAKQSLVLQALSPIVQEDEPATAKDIDRRVQSWRMSATAAARSPLAATGQTSLDPVNMPNMIGDLPTASTAEFELNLDDYAWSVSSVGPPDYDMESVASWGRLPSVHLDRRVEGSVCLTASVCTSFGPDDDYEPFSPASYMSRLPSPDLAWRMYEDVPPTPTTATSWGAPLSFPPSPAAFSYAASVDIAGRYLDSRPVTPTTATSWGAPLSYPPSPVMLSRPASPDIAWRTADSAPNSPRFRRATRAGQSYDPYYSAAQASTWQHVWPYTQEHQENWQHVWPYNREQQQVERMNSFVFPPVAQQVKTREAPGVQLGYPVLDIYPAVYPSFDIYPALLTLDDRTLGAPAVSRGAPYPIFDLYPAVYPSLNVYPAALTVVPFESKELSTRLVPSYPNVEIYPSVYPYMTIYPAVTKETRDVAIPSVVDIVSTTTITVHLVPGYPVFNIYPAVYPYSLDNIYLATTDKQTTKTIEVRLQASYPEFEIYPSVYPFSLDTIYPSVVAKEVLSAPTRAISVNVDWQYPIFDIYPAPSERMSRMSTPVSREVVVSLPKTYPVLDIYPAMYPWSVYEIYPAVPRKEVKSEVGVVVTLQSQYPVFNIYPAVYPWNVYEIYPVVSHKTVSDSVGIVVTLQSQYPVFNIYPAVYPYSLEAIYPVITSPSITATVPTIEKPNNIANKVVSGHVRKPSWKRGLPPVPPLPKNVHTLTPFSAASGRPLPPARIGLRIPVELPLAYPNVCPYPPVYPHFDLYPAAVAEVMPLIDVELSGKVAAVSQYPYLVIYPTVYPFIEVYPASWGPADSQTTLRVRRVPKYSPMASRAQVLASVKAHGPAAQRRRPRYTHLQLCAQVYAEARRASATPLPSPIHTMRTSLPAPAPPPARAPPPVPSSIPARPPVPVVARPSPPLPASSRRPPHMDLRTADDNEDDTHMQVPTIVAIKPSPTFSDGSDADTASSVLFEMVTAPPPAPQSAASPSVRSRSRSGTVSARGAPPASAPPRPMGARPPSIVQPPSSELPAPPAPGSLKRLSGLPAHPAINRRVSASAAPAPRPMSTFGPLPAVPNGAPAPAASPLPSPPEEWQRGWRTPIDSSSPASPLNAFRSSDLSRSKTMPTRAAPRGPRSSTMISERAKVFDNPNVIPNDDGPLKLSMLSEFPAPPRPSLPPLPSPSPNQSPVQNRPVSKLDRSRYPFA
ncbi:hypothetical protein C8Q80DRAFT_1154002 [Daedaleopsis nitida]|nr:hypothetical protein C8Q80DRAFT_1154002 [Daedaleopsis nitida]